MVPSSASTRKTSCVRYIGSLSFQFRRAEVRRFLIRAGAILQRRNPNRCCCRYWFRAALLLWDGSILVIRLERTPPSAGSYLRLPVGDLADIRDISAEQAAVGSMTHVNRIGGRYGAATVVIAEAVVDLGSSGERNVYLSLRYLGGPWSDCIDIRIFEFRAVKQMLRRFPDRVETSIQIEEDWKREQHLA